LRFSTTVTRRAAAWLAAAALAGGCGGESGPTREAVSGRVTFGGEPLARGSIQFLPRTPEPEGGAWGSVVDGAYAIAAADGPVAGEYSVSITSAPEGGEAEALPGDDSGQADGDAIPERYNLKTTLEAVVKPGEANVLDFALDRKPARKGRRP